MILTAKNIIKHIDLTNLSDTLDDVTLEELCRHSSLEDCTVAAICVPNLYIKKCKKYLVNNKVNVASVFNFPYGDANLEQIKVDILSAIDHGVDELDIVIPLNELQGVNDISQFKKSIFNYVNVLKKISQNKPTKLIISTDILRESSLIKAATEAVIDGGADFVKTCTGKTGSGITLQALQDIIEVVSSNNRCIGIKASGGIKTISFAVEIYSMVSNCYGGGLLTKGQFRIGTSALLVQLKNQLQQTWIIE